MTSLKARLHFTGFLYFQLAIFVSINGRLGFFIETCGNKVPNLRVMQLMMDAQLLRKFQINFLTSSGCVTKHSFLRWHLPCIIHQLSLSVDKL